MTDNWLRQTAVQIGSVYIDSLDIDFTVSSDAADEATATTATITIYNLSKATAQKISAGQLVKIWAGYSGDSGLLYLGRVTEAESDRDGADRYTKISCKDYEWQTNMRPRTYVKGTPISDIIRQLYADAALPAGPIINDLGVTTANAYTTNTSGKQTINDLIALINGDPATKAAGVSVHHTILGGQACVIASNQTTSDAHLINASSGLIETAPDTSEDYDQTAKCLLLWRIQTDALIRLESSQTTGWYIVAGYTHTADQEKYQTELSLKRAGEA